MHESDLLSVTTFVTLSRLLVHSTNVHNREGLHLTHVGNMQIFDENTIPYSKLAKGFEVLLPRRVTCIRFHCVLTISDCMRIKLAIEPNNL